MPIKVSIPLQGDGRIEVEGELDYIKTTIPHLKAIIEELGANVGFSTSIVSIGESIDNTNDSIPPIPASMKSSPTEVITYLFTQTAWGMKPRTLNDIKVALSSEGINRDSKTISSLLIQLVQASRLHRVKDKTLNVYVYSRY
ncbi:MAG: hypothetical protein ABSF36_00600 [Candidatus Methanomethylicaceae archaeon]|jgi:hypothetical protein